MEEVSVFSIDINDIKLMELKENFNYKFLDIISDKINVKVIYDLINTIDIFKIKNLYFFIYLKLIQINKKYKRINLINKNNHNLSQKDLNDKLNNYIQCELDCIIIINLIISYFFPNKKLINI
jgi:hypothetical protein